MLQYFNRLYIKMKQLRELLTSNTSKNCKKSSEEQLEMSIPHVLAVPFPAQGHVIPLMELVQHFVKKGFKVTFVNTDFNHKRVINALLEKDRNVGDMIHMVSLPDGLDPGEDRNDIGKLSEAVPRVMPEKLEKLIKNINATDNNKITCLVADENMGWALKVAEKMGIRRVAFWPASAAVLGSIFSIPKLIKDGIINNDGMTSCH